VTTANVHMFSSCRPLAWDVAVTDTDADSHLTDTATIAGAAADKAASCKEVKCRQLANINMFVPAAVETAGRGIT